jgi:C4-dicarboxylate-specific signal transduction histidine kinase
VIVRDLGGNIAAANDERGAVFAIVLPAAKG